jgi:3'-5' exoribonuclease
MRFIADFTEDEAVVGHYLCKKKELLTSKTGKPYISLKLADKTGEIDGKIWEPAVNIGPFEAGDFVKAEARAVLFQQALQLKIARLRKSREDEYDKADYIPAAPRDINDMHKELMGFADGIKNPYISALIKVILVDDGVISSKIKEHGAAKSMHHAYMGGLLEHTLSVTRLCAFAAGHYERADADMLIACAMLHDVGKIYELTELPNIDYTDEGELLGHIAMTHELISRAAEKIPGFPPTLKTLIQHVLLAHHGQYAFGSPKLPKTLEAQILHSMDNLDAKAFMFCDAARRHKGPGEWLGWNKALEGNIRTSRWESAESVD